MRAQRARSTWCPFCALFSNRWLAFQFFAATLLLFAQTPRSASVSPRATASSLDPGFLVPREETFVPSVDASKSVRVVTWNIERGEQLDRVANELSRNAADLYLFQEVDYKTRRSGNADEAAELAHRLDMNLVYGVEFEELSQEAEGNASTPAYTGQATLTRLPVRHSRVLRFERQSGFWKPRVWLPSSLPLLQRRLGDRIALVTDLVFGNRLLVVYNVHLESRSVGRIQSDQLDEVLADIAKQYPPNTAILLGGDLNTKYLPSIFLHKLERAGLHSATGERIERTHAIAMALDWIFVRGPIRIENGEVRRDLRGSDHYPVYAQVAAR
jgi:endonuclease/exonuclease/phosphatase family metal-dependent hydrolase